MDARVPDHVIKGLSELGALGMTIDEKYGGLGLSHVYYNRALALVSSVHSALSSLLSAHQSIGVPEPLKLFGTEEQKRRFLPRVASNEISAFLLTEPDVGSDPARMGTTAEPTDDGSAYLLNGTKLWTTNGVIADLLVVMAVVPKAEGQRGGITAFVVEAKSPGISVLHRNEFMGLRGIENGVTRFEDVRVPAENVVGKVGQRAQGGVDHLEHRAAFAACHLLVIGQGVAQDLPQLGERARPVGDAHREARSRCPQARLHRRAHLCHGCRGRVVQLAGRPGAE